MIIDLLKDAALWDFPAYQVGLLLLFELVVLSVGKPTLEVWQDRYRRHIDPVVAEEVRSKRVEVMEKAIETAKEVQELAFRLMYSPVDDSGGGVYKELMPKVSMARHRFEMLYLRDYEHFVDNELRTVLENFMTASGAIRPHGYRQDLYPDEAMAFFMDEAERIIREGATEPRERIIELFKKRYGIR